MKISKIIIALAIASSVEATDYTNLPNADATAEEFEKVIKDIEKCKNSTNANCLINALQSSTLDIDIELSTVCSLDPSIHPDCSKVIPEDISKELKVLQACFNHPELTECKTLPNEWQEVFKNYKPPITREEITAMYDEINAVITACVLDTTQPERKYIRKACTDLVPYEVIQRNKRRRKDREQKD